jgi:signal peptidase I
LEGHRIKELWDKYTQGWLGSIIYLILGFIIAFILNMALGIALNTDVPVVAVFSNSMVPTFYKGDMIIVYGDKNISIGDIIVFDSPDRKYPIIHRVYNITEEGIIITKGDNNSYPDPPRWRITRDKIHGKAILKIPLLGWVKILFVQITGLA